MRMVRRHPYQVRPVTLRVKIVIELYPHQKPVLVAPKPKVELRFQEKPYRAWVLSVKLHTPGFFVRVRTWFDDHSNPGHPPPPELTIPAAIVLERTARTAVEP